MRTWPAGGFHSSANGDVIRLNPGLMRWALARTQAIELEDTPAMRKLRAMYKGYAQAQEKPRVLSGANLSAETFWHGRLLDQWAVDWTTYMTEGKGEFVTTAMNDSGALLAIQALGLAGRADPNRVLLLRSASNFDLPHPGVSAAENILRERHGEYTAYLPSLDALYRVGSPILHEIVSHWSLYANHVPGLPDMQ